MGLKLRVRRDHLPDDRVRVVPVQRQPYHQLHSPGVSYLRAGAGFGDMADR